MIVTSIFLVVLLFAKELLGCTVIGVGREASATGYPIVTHNDDEGGTTTDIRLVRVPRKQWPEGSLRPLYNYQFSYPRIITSKDGASPDYHAVEGQAPLTPLTHIPQVPTTYAYWDTNEGAQNEFGLSIGESTTAAKTVGWPAEPGKETYGFNQVGIEQLTRIALERCKTARCGVETMGKLAVDLGFFSASAGTPEKPSYDAASEVLMLGDMASEDGGELWIFHIMTGAKNASAIWAAMRVPPDHVAVLSNSFTIHKMNLSDSDNFLYSPGVTDLAEEMGWWHPSEEESPELFDFFKAYGYNPTDKSMKKLMQYGTGRRMWRVFSLLSPEEGGKLDPTTGQLPDVQNPYPASVRAPRGSVTISQVMSVMRDHFEGTPYDLTKGMAAGPYGNPGRGAAASGVTGLWERGISVPRTVFSFLNEARPNGRSLFWFSYSCPHGSVYLPFYAAADSSAPDSFHSSAGSQSKFSTAVAYWAFDLVNQLSERNFQLINADIRRESAKIEARAQELVPVWEHEADLVAADAGGGAAGEAAALRVLTERSNAFAEDTV